MKRVKFLINSLVNDRTYREGDVADLEDAVADRLIAAKNAIEAGNALVTVYATAAPTPKPAIVPAVPAVDPKK